MAQIPPEILQLRETYEKAQIKLLDIIAKQEARGNVTTYRKAILAQTNAELKILDDFTVKWTKENVSKAYEKSVEDVYTVYRAAHISVPVIAANQRVIAILANNAVGQLTDAHRFVGRMIDDSIRKAGIEAIAEKVSVGDTVKATKNNLINKLMDKDIMSIKDKAGRRIKLEVYAELVARSSTREAVNKGCTQQLQEMGQDLVQMSNHSSSCNLCSSYEGRVYSISGESTEYPSLDIPFSGGYANIHVNCGHVLTPFIEKFADNLSEIKEFSNRSFDVDTQSKADKDRYNKNQQIKASRRVDRNEYEAARLAAPDQAPKTFSGFRAMKKANNENYKTLTGKIEKVAKPVIKAPEKLPPVKTIKPIIPKLSEIKSVNIASLNREKLLDHYTDKYIALMKSQGASFIDSPRSFLAGKFEKKHKDAIITEIKRIDRKLARIEKKNPK